MRKILFLFAVVILVFSINVFGQSQRKKKNFYAVPEVDDEVLVSFHKKQEKLKNSPRRKSAKRKVKPFFDEADALFGKRKKSIRRKRGVTHDPEFETWANRQHKPRKTRKP